MTYLAAKILPRDCWQVILSHVDKKSAFITRKVCKLFYDLVDRFLIPEYRTALCLSKRNWSKMQESYQKYIFFSKENINHAEWVHDMLTFGTKSGPDCYMPQVWITSKGRRLGCGSYNLTKNPPPDLIWWKYGPLLQLVTKQGEKVVIAQNESEVLKVWRVMENKIAIATSKHLTLWDICTTPKIILVQDVLSAVAMTQNAPLFCSLKKTSLVFESLDLIKESKQSQEFDCVTEFEVDYLRLVTLQSWNTLFVVIIQVKEFSYTVFVGKQFKNLEIHPLLIKSQVLSKNTPQILLLSSSTLALKLDDDALAIQLQNGESYSMKHYLQIRLPDEIWAIDYFKVVPGQDENYRDVIFLAICPAQKKKPQMDARGVVFHLPTRKLIATFPLQNYWTCSNFFLKNLPIVFCSTHEESIDYFKDGVVTLIDSFSLEDKKIFLVREITHSL